MERLSRYDAVQAIKRPLQTYGLSLDNSIEKEIESIVNDLSTMRLEDHIAGVRLIKGEFVEPIHLQVVCQRWWQRRSAKNTDEKIFLADIGDLDNVLGDFYEDVVHDQVLNTLTRVKIEFENGVNID